MNKSQTDARRNNKLPVMTTDQRVAIAYPDAGMQVYDSTLGVLCVYNGTTWKKSTVTDADE